MAEAVIERAPLRVRQHLVRLDELLEPVVRVGRVRDIRVVLPRERAKRLLDRVVARVPRNAEQRVVVVVDRRHQSSSKTPSEKRDSSDAAERTDRIAFS